VTGCAASMLLMRLATAKPGQEKATAPTMMSRRKAGPGRPGICAAKAAQPMASKTAVIARTDRAATRARAAMTALAGSGVARRRL
jgi:hypothetical protein